MVWQSLLHIGISEHLMLWQTNPSFYRFIISDWIDERGHVDKELM